MDSQNNANTHETKEGEHVHAEHTTTHTGGSKNNRTLFGVLSYLGPLVIISLLVDKDDSFVKFHIKQGLVLLCIEILLSVFSRGMWTLVPIYQLIHFAIIILIILGIINVMKGKERELPFVGSLARYFPI